MKNCHYVLGLIISRKFYLTKTNHLCYTSFFGTEFIILKIFSFMLLENVNYIHNMIYIYMIKYLSKIVNYVIFIIKNNI